MKYHPALSMVCKIILDDCSRSQATAGRLVDINPHVSRQPAAVAQVLLDGVLNYSACIANSMGCAMVRRCIPILVNYWTRKQEPHMSAEPNVHLKMASVAM